MEKEKPITHDLFGVDECDFCKGEGQVEVIEDCDECKGTGISQ